LLPTAEKESSPKWPSTWWVGRKPLLTWQSPAAVVLASEQIKLSQPAFSAHYNIVIYLHV